MQEIENIVQQEVFDMEVQYCDPDDCNYDCLQGINDCDAVITGLT